MANQNIEIVIKAVDDASSSLKKVSSTLKDVGGSALKTMSESVAATNDFKNAFEGLNKSIGKMSSGGFENKFKDLNSEISKTKNLLISLAKDANIDVSKVMPSLNEYSRLMLEPARQAMKEANEDLVNQTALTNAKILGDKKALAEAEYKIVVTALARERDAKIKALSLDDNDPRVTMKVNEWYKSQMALAEKNKQIQISGLNSLNQSLDNTAKKGLNFQKTLSSAFDKVKASAKGLAGAFSSVVKQALAFGTAQLAIAGLSTSFDSLGNALIGFNARMEQSKISFTNFFKSAEAADYFIRKLKTEARITPFEYEDLEETSRIMLAFGWSAQKILPDLRKIGDATAGIGKGAPELKTIVTQLGQMRGAGKVVIEDTRPLTNLGLPIEEIFRDKFKMSIKQVQDSGMEINKVIDALIDGFGARYKDMMAKQSKTFYGIMSNIKDNFSQIIGKTGETVFSGLKSILNEVVNWSDKFVEIMEKSGFKKAFENMIPESIKTKIAGIFNFIYPFFEKIKIELQAWGNGNILAGAFNIVLASLDSVTEAFVKIYDIGLWAYNGIKNFFIDLGANIYTVFEKTTEHIKIKIYEMVNSIQDAFSRLDMFKYIGIKFTPLEIPRPTESKKENIKKDYANEFQKLPDSNVIKTAYNFGKQYVSGHLTQLKTEIEKSQIANSPFSKFLDSMSETGKNNEKGEKVFNNIKSPLIYPNEKNGGSAAENKTFKLANRIQDAFNDLNQKIISETGSSYQLGMSKINDEIDKMQRELVGKGKMEGLDTSALEAKIGEYQNIMTEPIKRAWRDAWTGMRNDTNLIMAKMRDDKKAQAEAEFQIAVAGIEKEKEARLKALGTGDPVTDMQARIAVENEVGLKISQAKKERDDKERQAEIEKYNMRIEYNQLELDLNLKTQEEIDRLNRKELENKKKYLQEQFADERKSFAERYELRKQLAETEKSIQNTPLSGLEGFMSGLKQTSDSFGTWARNMQEVGRQTAMSMQSSFQEFFFDAMTGQLKSLGDYVKSFLQGIVRAISSALANAFSQKIISSILGGGGQESSSGGGFLSAITSLFGFRADGGPVYAGRPYIVGERGPELFVPSASGTIVPNHALKSASNSAPTVIVNVQNNLGVKAEVKQETKFDGQRYIVGVVLDAYTRNIGGMRTVMAGARG